MYQHRLADDLVFSVTLADLVHLRAIASLAPLARALAVVAEFVQVQRALAAQARRRRSFGHPELRPAVLGRTMIRKRPPAELSSGASRCRAFERSVRRTRSEQNC